MLADEHPSKLAPRHELGFVYQAAGHVPEAIAILQPLLAQPEQVLEAEHPDTLTTRDGLAGAYRAAGRDADAAELEAGSAVSGDAR